MLLFVENKRIFAGLSVSRWGWLLHNAAESSQLAENDQEQTVETLFPSGRRPGAVRA